ncbi:STAS domain-containing protein [Plastoroseomonas hellenica]|uniref:STAS domain-containing protein n=1 Tax=Plastoroseomonas hellenica TaxID=2687306 RepID=UPI001BA7BC69|nr:STAS domain-containing protein [Plastoroseomonas hellenica]MBR0642417.1 STAS domain-containing protein [Plastoroseomonas hellenica]
MQFRIVAIDAALSRVELSGRLDVAGAEMLEAPLTAQLKALRSAAVIDLSAVPFVGSLGIRVLVAAARLLKRNGQRVALYGAHPAVQEVFHTVALDQLIPIATDEAAARMLIRA